MSAPLLLDPLEPPGPGSTSLLVTRVSSTPRTLKDVPFVELYGDKLQGVVSSGSDIERVYVAFIERKTGHFYCSTNNNRPCGGLGSYPCKHLQWLLEEATVQVGLERVDRFLALSDDPAKSWQDLQRTLYNKMQKAPVSEVFSRFLSFLRLTELAPSSQDAPELAFFASREG